MVIVIVDSGLADRYTEQIRISFPVGFDESSPPVASGHGTAVFDIIHSKCGEFANIINFRIIGIEKGIDEALLIRALEYIEENIPADIINLSIGIAECDDIASLHNVCTKLTDKGIIIISAFDNAGSISYPAAFDNVIGVVNGIHCIKTDEFEYFDDSIVNIGAKGSVQRLSWDNPAYALLSGNSFACAHVTAQVAKMLKSAGSRMTKDMILKKFNEISIKKHLALNNFAPSKIPFRIRKAVIFPFSKEMHSLIRYRHLLEFEIIDVYDTKYSVRVGSTTNHIMKSEFSHNYVIKNIDKIDYDSFDTLILGHVDKLALAVKDENYVYKLVSKLVNQGKKIFSFDDISLIGFNQCKSIYYPSISKQDLPPNRLGMMYRTAKPVLGIFGTSSKQGKMTLQLKIRELLLKGGDSVGEIGTEPSSLLYGMDYVFPMGYNSTIYIDGYDSILYLNSAMNDISVKENDIIIVGSQSGTIPFGYGNVSQIPVYQHSFLLGTLPDCFILCINLFDPYEYIRKTIFYLEAVSNGKVIALATIPFVSRENDQNVSKTGQLMELEEFKRNQETIENIFGLPLYNIASKDDMERIVDGILGFFS